MSEIVSLETKEPPEGTIEWIRSLAFDNEASESLRVDPAKRRKLETKWIEIGLPCLRAMMADSINPFEPIRARVMFVQSDPLDGSMHGIRSNRPYL